jgi:hypothetical protein
VSIELVNLERDTASLWSGPKQAIGREWRSTPFPPVAINSGRLFLDGLLASRAHLCFTGGIRLTCSSQRLGQKGTFLLCRRGGHFYFALTSKDSRCGSKMRMSYLGKVEMSS